MMISIEHETDTAHRLSCHKGKCANLHGHRYKFVVSIEVKGTIEEEGFVDFYDLKKTVKDYLDRIFDHGTILKECVENEQLSKALIEMGCKLVYMSYEPTVEAMTEWMSVELNKRLKGRLCRLTIYETPTNYCTWKKEQKCNCKEN